MCIYVYIFIYIYTCVWLVYICMCIYMCIYMYIYICVCVSVAVLLKCVCIATHLQLPPPSALQPCLHSNSPGLAQPPPQHLQMCFIGLLSILPLLVIQRRGLWPRPLRQLNPGCGLLSRPWCSLLMALLSCRHFHVTAPPKAPSQNPSDCL